MEQVLYFLGGVVASGLVCFVIALIVGFSLNKDEPKREQSARDTLRNRKRFINIGDFLVDANEITIAAKHPKGVELHLSYEEKPRVLVGADFKELSKSISYINHLEYNYGRN